MADPGSFSSRWLSGRRLTAAELSVSADSLPVFKNSVEVQTLPASMYSAMAGGGGGNIRITTTGATRTTTTGSTRITA